MYAGKDFSVAETIEEQTFGFDFVRDVAIGDVIASTEWTIKVKEDSPIPDPAVASRKLAATSFGGTKAFQRFGGLVDGCVYTIECLATMASGDKVALHSHVTGQNPTADQE